MARKLNLPEVRYWDMYGRPIMVGCELRFVNGYVYTVMENLKGEWILHPKNSPSGLDLRCKYMGIGSTFSSAEIISYPETFEVKDR